METKEFNKLTSELSKQYDSIATHLIIKAKDLRNQDKLSFKEYLTIVNEFYKPLMDLSSRMLMDANFEIAQSFGGGLEEIKKSTDRLEEAHKRIKKSEHIFKAATGLLATAAAIVSFVSAPTPQTIFAAGEVAADAYDNISKVFNGEDS